MVDIFEAQKQSANARRISLQDSSKDIGEDDAEDDIESWVCTDIVRWTVRLTFAEQ